MHACTGQKLRFPTWPTYQHMTFPTHILQRIGQNVMQTNEIRRKSCPILQISYMHEIQINFHLYSTEASSITVAIHCVHIVSLQQQPHPRTIYTIEVCNKLSVSAMLEL